VLYGSHDIVRTIHVTKKLDVQTKRLKVLVCYDFHFGISNDKKDVMFAIELDMFSIGTIIILIHTEPILKLVHVPNIVMLKQILKQPVKLISVLGVKLTIPPNIIKQHLPETFFHLEVREMIVNETLSRKQIQDLTIIVWTIIEEEQLTKVNLGTKENVQ